MSEHVSEDNCLECPEIDLDNKRGRMFWCKSIKSYIRTNPICWKGWDIILEKKKARERQAPQVTPI